MWNSNTRENKVVLHDGVIELSFREDSRHVFNKYVQNRQFRDSIEYPTKKILFRVTSYESWGDAISSMKIDLITQL